MAMLVLALALVLRAAVPSGWMVDHAPGGTIKVTMCSGTMAEIPLGKPGGEHPGKSQQECPYGALGQAVTAPPALLSLAAVPPAAQAVVAVRSPLILARTAWLEPPGHAPPYRV